MRRWNPNDPKIPDDLKERIVEEARVIRGTYGVDADNPGACLYDACAVIEAAKRRGIKLVMQAGSAGWPRLTMGGPHDDGVCSTHFSYKWEWPAAQIALSKGNLPEMHVWAGDPSRQELVDISTRFWPEQCKTIIGEEWPEEEPPDFFWGGPKLPAGVYYEPDLQATMLAHKWATDTCLPGKARANPTEDEVTCPHHGVYTTPLCLSCFYDDCEECEEPDYYTLPADWASYIIGGDASGLNDGEEEEIDAFLKAEDYPQFTDVGEKWFSSYNDASNMGGDVAKYYYYRLPVAETGVSSLAKNLALLLKDKESEKVNQVRKEDGRLPAYVWPGGYPLYYVVRDDGDHDIVLCPKHANEEELEALADEDYNLNDLYTFKVLDYDVNYENDDLLCEHGHPIESAYGDSDEPDELTQEEEAAFLVSAQLGQGVKSLPEGIAAITKDKITFASTEPTPDSGLPSGEDFDTFDEWLVAIWKHRADVERAAGTQLISEPEAYRITVVTGAGHTRVLEGDELAAFIEEIPEGVSPEDYAIVSLSDTEEE